MVPTNELKAIFGDRFEYGGDTLLVHLGEIDVVAEVSRGCGRMILHERKDKGFFDPDNRERLPLLEEEVTRFLEDLHEQENQVLESKNAGDDETQSVADGGELEDDAADIDSDTTDDAEEGDEGTDDVPTTLCAVAAAALDIEIPVEDVLTDPTDHIEWIVRFDDVATAIIESDEVSRGRAYEPMGWRKAANKWVLTTTAKARKENESLS